MAELNTCHMTSKCNDKCNEMAIKLMEKDINHQITGREMRFVGGDVLPVLKRVIPNVRPNVFTTPSDQVKDYVDKEEGDRG